MKFLMLCRNLIECNPVFSTLFNIVGANPIYKYFTNKIIDKRIVEIRESKKYKIMIEICSICNAKCVFCPYVTLKRSKKIMSDEIFDKIIYRLKEEQINPRSIELYMIGEPFIDKKIFERAEKLKREFPNASIEVTSNFGMVNDEIIENLLKSPISFINISLNAASSKSYKTLMDLDYQTTVDNINKLIDLKKKTKSKLRIQLSMVLCDENIKEKTKFWLQWLYKVDSLRFQRAVEWVGLVPLKNKKLPYIKQYYPCYEIYSRIPILSNGDFALCCQDAEGLIKKNIMDTKILDAYNSEYINNIRKVHMMGDIKNMEMCNKCTSVNANGANWITKF